MQERSFRRATLFGVMGALAFLVIGAVLCELMDGLKDFVLFRRQQLKVDLVVIAVQLRFNLFVIVGFIVGWAVCLFRGTRRAS